MHYCISTDTHNIAIASSNFKALHDHCPQFS